MLDKFESSAAMEQPTALAIQNLTLYRLREAVLQARAARERGISWRDFKVGAALIGLTTSPLEFRTLTGANKKLHQDDEHSLHAEQDALTKAELIGVKAVSVVAVVGETQPDEQSGREMVTLHPCGKCRDALEASPLIHPEATLIASALPNLRTIELYNLNGLIRFHESGDSSGIHQIEYPWLSDYSWSESINTFLTRHRAEALSKLDD